MADLEGVQGGPLPTPPFQKHMTIILLLSPTSHLIFHPPILSCEREWPNYLYLPPTASRTSALPSPHRRPPSQLPSPHHLVSFICFRTAPHMYTPPRTRHRLPAPLDYVTHCPLKSRTVQASAHLVVISELLPWGSTSTLLLSIQLKHSITGSPLTASQHLLHIIRV